MHSFYEFRFPTYIKIWADTDAEDTLTTHMLLVKPLGMTSINVIDLDISYNILVRNQ